MSGEVDKAKYVYSKFTYIREASSAFQADVERLLLQFEKTHSLKFADFAKIWREMNFTYVFGGLCYLQFIKDLTENMFYVVKKYIYFPRSIYTQVGAVYLLYGLYFKQPVKNFVKIRLTLEEYEKLSNCVEGLKRKKELEMPYIFAKLKANNAFLYVAERKTLGPEERFIKAHEVFYDNTFESLNSESSITKFEEAVSCDVVVNLKQTQDKYEEALKKFARKNPSFSNFKSTLMDDIKIAAGKFESFNYEIMEEEAKKLKAIKNKAFTNKNATYRAMRSCPTAMDIKSKMAERKK